MNKNFGEYQYLTMSNEGDFNSKEQYIVVHEQGQVIIDKPFQYVTQMEDTKEFEVPVYDVGSQPLYIQLDNSSELIPISVNSICPRATQMIPQSNLFESNLFLPSGSIGQMNPEPGIENAKYTKHNMDILDTNKLTAGYAEITLNDKQYETLKQKGWILLEIDEKVFLLDSSGLHEITNDFKLVHKLRQESQIESSNSEQGCPMKVVMIPSSIANGHTDIHLPCSVPSDPMEIVDEITKQENSITATNIDNVATKEKKTFTCNNETPKLGENDTLKNFNINNNTQVKKKSSKIQIKSQYLLKDIPKEITLGKTTNGKNLVARVVKRGFFKNVKKQSNNNKTEFENNRILSDKEFAGLVQQALFNSENTNRMNNISSLGPAMSQILKVPDLKADLLRNKLIITKTIRTENEKRLIVNESGPSIVTGRFIINGCEGKFLHIPDLLKQHIKESELCEKTNGNLEKDMFLHINITETKGCDNISRVSVMVNKRYFQRILITSIG